MFIDQTNYMINKLSKRAGVRLVLHDPKTPPLPEEEGMDLAPNTASSVAVQMVTLTTGMSQRAMTRLRDLTPAVSGNLSSLYFDMSVCVKNVSRSNKYPVLNYTSLE